MSGYTGHHLDYLADRERDTYDRLHQRITEANHMNLIGAARAVRSFLYNDHNPVYGEALMRTLDYEAFEALRRLDWEGDPTWSGVYTEQLSNVMSGVHEVFRGILESTHHDKGPES